MKYAHLNEQGHILGWYDSEIHDTIPTPNIEVTDEQWQSALDSGANAYIDNAFVNVDTRTSEQQTSDQLTEAKTYLKETDWYYARKQETGQEVPADVVATRIEKRNLINTLEG